MGLILLYHRIAAVEHDPWRLAVSPWRFDEQMAALRRELRPLPLRELVAAELELRPVGDAVAVTFDDGYRDVATAGTPALDAHDVPATIFLVADALSGEAPELWWDELTRLVLAPEALPAELALELPSGGRSWDLRGADRAVGAADRATGSAGWCAWGAPGTPRQALYLDLWRILRDLAPAHRAAVLGALRAWSPAVATAPQRTLLSAAEARELVGGGLLEPGAHGRTHSRLAGLRGAALDDEVAGVRGTLRELLGRDVETFAYPFGGAADVSPAALAAAEAAGYELACANAPGAVGATSDRFFLPRLYVEDWDGEELLRRIRTLMPATTGSRGRAPRRGRVRFGQLRRLEPVSRTFGFDRGQPIDRFYIERFLARRALAIRGRVLEVGDDAYTRRFGGARAVEREVLHVAEGNPRATVVADLAHAPQLADASFDCVVLTQTLQLVADAPAAVRTLYRILKPGGAVLATLPGVTSVAGDEWGGSWHWGFGPQGARRLFANAFAAADVTVECFGNVLAATAFLHGLAAQELTPGELLAHDPAYPMLLGVLAVRRPEAAIAVAAVDVAPMPSAALAGGWLDTPRPGESVPTPELEIAGWVVGGAAPVTRVEAAMAAGLVGGEPSLERPDVAALHGAAALRPPGFRLSVPVADAGDRVVIDALLENGERARLAEVRLERRAPAAGLPLVSVVIPCRDQGGFLGEAVASALGQTHRPVEVVVVDDGSRDDTAEVAARAGVVLLRQSARGLAAARNAGFAASRGRFVVFLDADDRLLPGAVASGLAALDRRPDAALACGGYRDVDVHGALLREMPAAAEHRDPYAALLERNFVGMLATVLYRREVLEEEGFDPSLPAAEDYDQLLRVARRYPLCRHSAMVAEYRRHGAAMSADPARMLAAVDIVLRRQRDLALGHPEWRAALDGGHRFWRDYYGPPMRERLAGHLAAREWRAALRDLAGLVRRDPSRLLPRRGPR